VTPSPLRAQGPWRTVGRICCFYTQRRVGHLIISFGATTPPAHPEDGDAVSARNVGKPSQPDVAVCPRKNITEFCRRESLKTYAPRTC